MFQMLYDKHKSGEVGGKSQERASAEAREEGVVDLGRRVRPVKDSESLSSVTEAWSFCYQGSPLWGLPVFFLFGVLFLFQKFLLKCS